MTSLSSSLDLATYHPQKQSPLFGVFPGEIRNKIFAFALLQYEDNAAAYPEDSYWYRPGFKGPKRGNSSLLRTCKLAYAEGQKVFLEEIEWAFWFGMLVLAFCTVSVEYIRSRWLTAMTNLRPWTSRSLGLE